MLLKDLRIELRQRYAINSILLYVVSAVLISYLSMQGLVEANEKFLSSLFWIIITFSAVNAVSKSFIQESPNRWNYYFMLASANAVLISKMIYNSLLVVFMALICFAVFSLFLSFFPERILLFLTALFLGSMGYASILTMMSSIASKTNANFALVAVLSFPLLLPLLLLLVKLTLFSLNAEDSFGALNYILILLALDVLVWILSVMLFPYVWRD